MFTKYVMKFYKDTCLLVFHRLRHMRRKNTVEITTIY